jgi:predicted DNA-binding transcriptional regulator AlpA
MAHKSKHVARRRRRLITIEAACAVVGGDQPIDKSTYYRGIAAGRFPKLIEVSPGVRRADENELIDYIEARAAERHPAAA